MKNDSSRWSSKAEVVRNVANVTEVTTADEGRKNETNSGHTAQRSADPHLAIVHYLTAHSGWHAKADVVRAIGITDGQWNAAIAGLLASGTLERHGERRGARYRIKGGSA